MEVYINVAENALTLEFCLYKINLYCPGLLFARTWSHFHFYSHFYNKPEAVGGFFHCHPRHLHKNTQCCLNNQSVTATAQEHLETEHTARQVQTAFFSFQKT